MDNTVNGKELPIYSVETEEKKVALSFAAAWGDGNSGYIKWRKYERKAIATVMKLDKISIDICARLGYSNIRKVSINLIA